MRQEIKSIISIFSGLLPANIVGDGSKDVTTAGTAEAISTTQRCKWVAIIAKSTNTGNVYVGGSTIDSTRGIPLAASESISLPASDLSLVYIDVDTNGEGVTFAYGN